MYKWKSKTDTLKSSNLHLSHRTVQHPTLQLMLLLPPSIVHKHREITPHTLIIIILGQHYSTAAMQLQLLNIATPLRWCSHDSWENSTPPPSPLCLSVVQLPLINWRLNTRCKEESGQRPRAPSSLSSNYHEQSHCNRTKVACLLGDEVEDLSYRIEVRWQCVFVTEKKGFPLGDRSLRLSIVTSGTNTYRMFDLCAH